MVFLAPEGCECQNMTSLSTLPSLRAREVVYLGKGPDRAGDRGADCPFLGRGCATVVMFATAGPALGGAVWRAEGRSLPPLTSLMVAGIPRGWTYSYC